MDTDDSPSSPTDSEPDEFPCFTPTLPTEPMHPAQFGALINAESEPRLLFRAASAKSRGGPDGNSMTSIDPLHPTLKHPYTWDDEYYDSFYDMPWERANLMLNSHLRWVYERPSGFSSWSSSLLDALMHAARRRDEKQNHVIVYVLDTTKLQGHSRIFSATKLMKIFKQDKQPSGNTYLKRARGEHLVYGPLTPEDGFVAASFESLIEAGLFKIAKRLDTSIRREYNVDRVHTNMQTTRSFYLRDRHKQPPKRKINGPVLAEDGTEYWPFLPNMIPILRDLGCCFGPIWEGVMTIAFATMRRRYVHPDSPKFDLMPLLAALEDLSPQPLGDLEGMDYDEDVLREDHVQMLDVWKLWEGQEHGSVWRSGD